MWKKNLAQPLWIGIEWTAWGNHSRRGSRAKAHKRNSFKSTIWEELTGWALTLAMNVQLLSRNTNAYSQFKWIVGQQIKIPCCPTKPHRLHPRCGNPWCPFRPNHTVHPTAKQQKYLHPELSPRIERMGGMVRLSLWKTKSWSLTHHIPCRKWWRTMWPKTHFDRERRL